ncbi:alkyl hydroperoxide reductase subunit F [Dyella nitratireducens]|uniref:Alkyl hydroperoxide reductase subunit F n=1 Tax=Dyella nitratireducens TaxID=1849580 RepID=A0ABQ1FQN3_9GAMM|nr:alkyl hydroperoxide reductase subunit F [Dyella nitratireducens]GGA25696.1 alkyl hydroperoxide reductase subunit F [Dyella nitratireducens]GLQ43650.1 alkyl hydroperoxide reductase subunit F [Dyella nitratireducens]
MLDNDLKEQLRAYLERVTHPIELVASVDESAASQELLGLLRDIESLSPKVSLRTNGHDARKPSFAITRSGTDVSVRFAGIPLGHEFTSLVLALLQVGGHPPKAEPELIEQVRNLEGEYVFETFMSLSCHSCPDTVQALNLMSVLNPNIKHVTIDGSLFQDEVNERQVMAVPTVFLNGQPFDQGRMSIEQIVSRLDSGAAQRDAEKLNAKAPFEVLVVGGGPAGAASAIYSARKGIRTGVAAERFGGQVLDTMAIENFISVSYTEGPKLAASLEQHVHEYDVDVMNLQRAEQLIPAQEEGGLIEVRLAGGASLKAKTVILSTGARWRNMNVPGEQEYRNKGVTYCPHCDGPLFKGKRVAVVGGGNSGVEAAIDLAGIVDHVTLFEFDSKLRADEVLQRKLRSLPNVKVIVSAQTTEVLGDGNKVTGLAYTDRTNSQSQHVALEGVFVQIGLLPNTEWLKGTVKLSPRGEIEVDAHGKTSVPGVFAAGDVTTTPYKQIVIAMGDGAKAALSAFDYLIRLPVEVTEEEEMAA